MPYPGDRRRKRKLGIKASVITGELNLDFPAFLTHVNFKDADKTLGGANAMAQGAADVAFSLDEAGTTWLDREIVRCELSATPADSRIEIVVTVPASHISDTVDSFIYAWWGSETETQPAADGLYGKYAVWNGPTRSGFTPFVTWAVWHLGENPGDPTPQYKDSSGNGRHMSAPYSATRIDTEPGRGLQTIATSGDPTGVRLTPEAVDAPGTGPWCVINVASVTGDGNIIEEDFGGGRYLSHKEWTVHFRAGPYDNQIWRLDEAYDSSSRFTAMSRDGDVCTCVAPYQNDTITGLLNTNFNTTNEFLFYYDSPMDRTRTHSFACNMRSAPNLHWLVALRNNLKGTNIWDDTFDSQPAAITAEIYFDGLNEGTEVRVYEQPHGQSWKADFDGITPADLNSKYITCQIQSSTDPVDDYFWFNYNSTGTDPNLAGAGHEIAIAVGDTIADVAAELQSVANGVTDLSATVDGSEVTVLNERFGELSEPTTDSDVILTLLQVGGTATGEICGIEESVGTSFTGEYQLLRPRRARVVMLAIPYEFNTLSVVLVTSGVVVPAGALQREDENYANPS